MGQDIDGACGQLVVNFQKTAASCSTESVADVTATPTKDIEDLSPVKATAVDARSRLLHATSQDLSPLSPSKPSAASISSETISWILLLFGVLGLFLRCIMNP